jgi:hypothetical protein
MDDTIGKKSTKWSKVIAAQEASGLSASAFCAKRGIGLWSFYRWRSRLRKASQGCVAMSTVPASFIEVSPSVSTEMGSSRETSWQVVLELGDGMRLTFRRS